MYLKGDRRLPEKNNPTHFLLISWAQALIPALLMCVGFWWGLSTQMAVFAERLDRAVEDIKLTAADATTSREERTLLRLEIQALKSKLETVDSYLKQSEKAKSE